MNKNTSNSSYRLVLKPRFGLERQILDSTTPAPFPSQSMPPEISHAHWDASSQSNQKMKQKL